MQGSSLVQTAYLTGAVSRRGSFVGAHGSEQSLLMDPDDDFSTGCANRVDSLRVEVGKDWPHSRLRE
jgi:hypothetical protein